MRTNKSDRESGGREIKNFPWEKKLEIAAKAMTGFSVTHLARINGIRRQSIYRWIKELKGFAEEGWKVRRQNYVKKS